MTGVYRANTDETGIPSFTQVASYTYDYWGNVLTKSGEMADVNPFRYRGYYQDNETGFYYLQSRYYDPSIGRFINADAFASTGQGFLGYNMFAYCNNNPVVFYDPNGHSLFPTTCLINDGGSAPKSPYDVGDGNYKYFDEKDLKSSATHTHHNISEDDVFEYSSRINAGDFGEMSDIWTVILPGWVSVLLGLKNEYDSVTKSNAVDPMGRELYLEKGYTVVRIIRVYCDGSYVATETEFFVFDRDGNVVFNDVLADTYMVG